MSPKENLLAMLRGEQPGSVINGWEPFQLMMNPVSMAMLPLRPGAITKDAWGVSMHWPADQPGVMPMEGDLVVCPDVEEWKDVLHAPDLAHMEFDWEPFKAQQEAIRAEGKLPLVFIPVGNFELLHNLLGFENCLMNFLLEPEIMKEIVDYIVEWRMEYYRLIVENLHPDIIMQHDDWGAKEAMLMNPDLWREIIKPGYQRMYDYLHENGVLIMHHADSFLEPIVQDMEELHIDIWQGVLPQNDIVKIQSQLKHMILMGGIDAAITDHADVPEETVRAEVRRACETYVPGGHFIPSCTAGAPNGIYERVDNLLIDEIARFADEYHV